MKKEIPQLILAPMAGITDLPFRLICKEHGADILYSEMVSAAGLVYNKTSQSKTLELVKSCQEDSPLILQLFGSNPKEFAQATKLIDDLPEKTSQPAPSKPDGLDINFGCPVKKVIKQGAGVALMSKPKLAREIIQAVLDNTSLPVSIKIRAGIKDIDALKFLDQIADLDWGTVIVHGRTFKEGFSGPIDLQLIKRIKGKFPTKKIIANGGVLTPENAQEILEKTKADGIAIARGALGKPWLFQQIKDYLQTGKYQSPTLVEIKKVVLRHAQLMKKYKGEKSIVEFRKHLGWYFRGFPEAKASRKKLFEVKNFDEIKNVIEKI